MINRRIALRCYDVAVGKEQLELLCKMEWKEEIRLGCGCGERTNESARKMASPYHAVSVAQTSPRYYPNPTTIHRASGKWDFRPHAPPPRFRQLRVQQLVCQSSDPQTHPPPHPSLPSHHRSRPYRYDPPLFAAHTKIQRGRILRAIHCVQLKFAGAVHWGLLWVSTRGWSRSRGWGGGGRWRWL